MSSHYLSWQSTTCTCTLIDASVDTGKSTGTCAGITAGNSMSTSSSKHFRVKILAYVLQHASPITSISYVKSCDVHFVF